LTFNSAARFRAVHPRSRGEHTNFKQLIFKEKNIKQNPTDFSA
jgi:hypothetical protein